MIEYQLVLPEFGIHFFFNFLFLICGEWFTLILNAPLIAYHIYRFVNPFCSLELFLNLCVDIKIALLCHRLVSMIRQQL